MEVFQEGRKKQLFPSLPLVEVESLGLQSEGNWRPSQEQFQWICKD